MFNRRRFWLRSHLRFQGLGLYGNLSLWQSLWHKGGQGRWTTKTTEITFGWLLGLLGGSFVTLHLNPGQGWLQGALRLATWLQALVRAEVLPPPADPNRWLLVGVGLITWVCFLAGSRPLTQTLGAIYQGQPVPPTSWVRRFIPWVITVMLLTMVAIAVALVTGPADAPGPERWGWLIGLGRWIAAIGVLGLGLGVVYRLSPSHWVPGTPLLPGTVLTIAGWLLVQGLSRWGIQRLVELANYGLLLGLGVGLVGLYSLVLLMLVGAQFNVLTRSSGPGPGKRFGRRRPPPPPSFDSFKINR